jgi:hypothetical protein
VYGIIAGLAEGGEDFVVHPFLEGFDIWFVGFKKKARIPSSVNMDEWRFSLLTAFKKVTVLP